MGRANLSLAVLLCATIASTASAEPVVSLVKVVESREFAIEKSSFDGWNTGVKLSLRVSGIEVKDARKYGKVKVDKAVDDIGTDLTKASGDRPSSMMMESMQDVPEPMQGGFGGEKPKEGIAFDVDLPALPPRKASRIDLVKGSLSVVVGGEKKVVKVASLKANLGKPVESPDLKAVGVTFTLGKTDSNGLQATLVGDPSKLAAVKIVDGGNSLSNGSMTSNNGNTHEVTYFLESPLTDTTELQIEVWPGQKTLQVPFELKDIKLP